MTRLIGTYREYLEESYPDIAPEYPWMRDSLSDEPVQNKEVIIEFLTSAGTVGLVGMDYPKDIFTGERIPYENESREDEEYEWDAPLAYYVDKYNLQLPQDFIGHILEAKGSAAT